MARRKAVKYVHVMSAVIRSNLKTGDRAPPVSVRPSRAGAARLAWRVPIYDAAGAEVAAIVYDPDSPLKCGATTYCECYCPDPPAAQPRRARAAQSTRAGGASSAG